ncbi:hypothetical protein Tco_0205874 [Tanacetum coccineum]
MDVHVHHEVPSQQTPTLLTVPVSIISDSSPVFSTIIPQSLPSFTPPQQSTSTTPPKTETTNPPSTFPDFASVFQFNNRVIAMEKEVAELKKDPLHTQVTALVDDHLDIRLGATRDEFMNFFSASLTTRITEQLKKILIDKMDKSESYLAAPEHRECYKGLITSYDLDKTIFSTYGKVYSLKRSRKDKDKDEDPFAGSDRGLKKRKTSKDAKPTKGPKAKESQLALFKGTKSRINIFEKVSCSIRGTRSLRLTTRPNQSLVIDLASLLKKPSKTFDELMSTPIDFSAFIMNGLKINNLTQETLLRPAFRLLKGTHSNYAELEYDFDECYKALSEKLDWENREGGDYPFDFIKHLTLVMSRNHQKTKEAKYDLLGIEDMDPNIWNHVNVAYDKHVLWGISHWREQRKTFYGFEVMGKYGYGYLKDIIVRRTDNDLYRFKEGDFPCLQINDIKDLLLLVVQNRLINLLGDDVSEFVIAIRMFTRIRNSYKNVHQKLGYSEASRRSSTRSPKLLEEDQRHQARNYQIRNQEKGPIHCILRPSRIHLCRQQ